jgi:hypothetical protein
MKQQQMVRLGVLGAIILRRAKWASGAYVPLKLGDFMATVGGESMFGRVLEAVEQLTPEEQEDLAAIVQRRLIERRRQQILQDASDARQEFAELRCSPATVDELMDEILS